MAKLKEAHVKLYELERQALATISKIVEELHIEFSIELFEKYLNINASDYNGVYHCYQRKIDQLKAKGQIKTAEGYETGLQSLKLFTGKKQLSFAEMDRNFLENFEAFFCERINH